MYGKCYKKLDLVVGIFQEHIKYFSLENSIQRIYFLLCSKKEVKLRISRKRVELNDAGSVKRFISVNET